MDVQQLNPRYMVDRVAQEQITSLQETHGFQRPGTFKPSIRESAHRVNIGTELRAQEREGKVEGRGETESKDHTSQVWNRD